MDHGRHTLEKPVVRAGAEEDGIFGGAPAVGVDLVPAGADVALIVQGVALLGPVMGMTMVVQRLVRRSVRVRRIGLPTRRWLRKIRSFI